MGLPRAEARLHDDFPPTASLLAEIERLKREVAVARARIGELEARADIDPMLDILNRRGFERELKRAIAYVKRYGTQAALLFVDLDGFKAVNDHHGHGAGDALLKAVTRELVVRVRASDVVGRLGGDEFGVVIWWVGEIGRIGQGARTGKSDRKGQCYARSGPGSGRGQRGRDAASCGRHVAEIIAAADRTMYARKEEKKG